MVIVSFHEDVTFDDAYSGVYTFLVSGQHRGFFQDLAMHIPNLRTASESDFFVTSSLVDKILAKDGTDIAHVSSVKEIEQTKRQCILIDFNAPVEYDGTSHDSAAGEVHVFRVPLMDAGFGYGEYTGMAGLLLPRELRIPVALVDRLVDNTARLVSRHPVVEYAHH